MPRTTGIGAPPDLAKNHRDRRSEHVTPRELVTMPGGVRS